MTVLRAARPADAEAIAALTYEGFASYRSFAPAGWEPPPAEREVSRVHDLAAQATSWWFVAERDGDIVGHSSFIAAGESVHSVEEPGLAHVRALFVTQAFWGTGVATELHAAAVAAAREHGFTAMRLFTPAQQERARRFYEREGWTLVAGPDHEPALGLDLVEYRLDLT